MNAKRPFTAKDIRMIVEAFRYAPDVSPEKFAGMELIAGACAEFEGMSDLDIDQLIQKIVSAPAATKDT
jgi:hypothetical protein